MFLYSHCRQGSIAFYPFYKFDKAVDYALSNIEVIIGRAGKPKSKAKMKDLLYQGLVFQNYQADDHAGDNHGDPQPLLPEFPDPPVQFHFDNVAMGAPVAAPFRYPQIKTKPVEVPSENKEELDKIFEQIDLTRTTKSLQDITKTIQMVEDYLYFTTGESAIRHCIEEVSLPNVKERVSEYEPF